MDDRSRRWWLFGVFAAYLMLAAILPAVDDEVYYWCWSKELQWSYYDHPPMTAVLIRLSTTLFGDSVFAFRVPACVASAFVLSVISRLTRSRLIVAGVLLSPLFTFGAVMITPDSPLVMFWAAYLWWLIELHTRLQIRGRAFKIQNWPISRFDDLKNFVRPILNFERPTPIRDAAEVPWHSIGWEGEAPAEPLPSVENVSILAEQQVSRDRRPTLTFWLIGGVILGCGVLSKYTMGLAVPTSFISLLFIWRLWKVWLPGYIFHGIVAFAVASPILIYNIDQNFEPLLFQWRHAAERSPSGLMSFGDFVGGQIVLFGTLPFCLLPWVCFNVRRLCRNPRLRVCMCLYAPLLLFFLNKSAHTRLQGNWAFVCFVSFWPLASVWYQSVRRSRSWRVSTVLAFSPPALAVVLATTHLISPISIVPIQMDRAYRQIAMNTASREIARRIREHGEALPVYTKTYQVTSLLRFQSLDARQIEGATRPSHFTRPPRHLTDVDRAYFVGGMPLEPEFTAGFGPPELIARVPVQFRGKTDVTFNIWLYTKEK